MKNKGFTQLQGPFKQNLLYPLKDNEDTVKRVSVQMYDSFPFEAFGQKLLKVQELFLYNTEEGASPPSQFTFTLYSKNIVDGKSLFTYALGNTGILELDDLMAWDFEAISFSQDMPASTLIDLELEVYEDV